MSEEQNNGFNYWITKLFLNNNRLTILSLLSLIVFGVVSVLMLNTTGFPNPEIKLAIVQTVYPGASSQTVLEDVSVPLEGAVKNVEGVSRYSSTSSSSFSILSVTIEEDADSDIVINRLESAVSAVSLPSGAESPTVFKPQISGADTILALSGQSKLELFEISNQFKQDAAQLDTLSAIESPSELQQFAVVRIRPEDASQFGITTQAIQTAISSIGESIPVVNGVAVNDVNSSILTRVAGDDLQALQELQLQVNVPAQFAAQLPSTVALQDIADVSLDYIFDNEASVYGFSEGQDTTVAPITELLYLDAVDGIDQAQFNQQVQEILKSYSEDKLVVTNSANVVEDYDANKVNAIQVYSVADENQEQIDEVVGGLVGSPLDIDNDAIAWVGWLLGGIQLVVLVMIAFVSWRAAVIAAAAIPFSLAFTTIYLLLIGESLNTLVLFSLVLVIGLVVDPALVMLEAIQRKIDAGKPGKDAVLAAVKDVGNGIFLAALTNIIVFAPFGVLSGILGQIFAYIPLTILPAIVGSYVVPLVFLAWLGGLFLRPNAQARKAISSITNTADAEKELEKLEEKNMWPIARWLISVNRTILNSHPLIRTAIIVVLLVFSVGIAAGFTATEQVRVATFAVNENTDILLLTGTHRSENVSTVRRDKEEAVVGYLLQQDQILEVSPFVSQGAGFTYRVNVDLEALENDQTSLDFARQTSDFIEDEYADDFFDIQLGILKTGPPVPDYQITLAIFTDDLQLAETAAMDIRDRMFELCKLPDNSVSISAECVDDSRNAGEKVIIKVDDGFTGKAGNSIEVIVDRDKLQAAQAIVPNAPLSILVNQTIAQLYEVNRGETVTDIEVDGDVTGVLIENDVDTPQTITEIEDIDIFTLAGTQIKLGDVATVEEVQPPQNIERNRGRTVTLVQGRLNAENADNQGVIQSATTALVEYYSNDDFVNTTDLGLEKEGIGMYDDGSSSETLTTLIELVTALAIAIIFSYLVLVLFFKSFTQPLAIIYTVPLTFIGVYPGLAYFGGGQIGFLEIIGIIILVGVVENVAIFLIDSANQKIAEGMPEKEAITYAAGIRFRPVVLTSLTALASLLPLAIFSIFYRSIAVVIIGGILASGIVSLITTPILFVFFRWLSRAFRGMKGYNQALFVGLPVVGIALFALTGVGLPQVLALLVGTTCVLVPFGYIIVLAMTGQGKEV